METTISIIFAVHNGENGLKAALESIKKQSLRSFEVVMVDAASDDDTPKIMKTFVDRRFNYYRIESDDISDARNMGLQTASGEYIGFCDNNVQFSRTLLAHMADAVKKSGAELCVSRMASSDVYGTHAFTSTRVLSHRSLTNKYDMDLIWNPSVTNKLFRRQTILENGFLFQKFGKAQDAAFSLPFAYASERIVCCSKGLTIYTVPVADMGVAKVGIDDYRRAYDYIIQKANEAFDVSASCLQLDFDIMENEKLRVCYADTVRHKEITVLLYSYYRNFWSLADDELVRYTAMLKSLYDKLSENGKAALLSKNRDIFYDGNLIDNKSELSKLPRATICIGRCDNRGHFDRERMKTELDSIYGQTMPNFELFVDSRLAEFLPDEYVNNFNLKIIEAESISDFKQKALTLCNTEYIMFLDGYVQLNPKILMRHYYAHSTGGTFGFTTSPLTRFDGQSTQRYKFSDIAFFDNIGDSRTSDSDSYVFDLFFCNKLFRVRHLRGIHFVFTDNTIFDMYKLYELCRFKKLSHRGTYFPYNEDNVIRFLKNEQDLLPENCKEKFKRYKALYFIGCKMKDLTRKAKTKLKKSKAFLRKKFEVVVKKTSYKLPVRNRVLFYTIRSDNTLLENSKAVYDALDTKKVMFAKPLPHSAKMLPTIYRLLLTSKVVVTDDYLKYLRYVKLKPKQSVIQIWHAGGAFKRFGLDAPSRLTKLEEYQTHSQYSTVCVTSDYVRQFYAHAFGIDIDTVKAVGSPRTDMLLDKNNRERLKNDVISRHPLLRDKKVIVYLPTFREKNGSRIKYDPKINWEKLNDELADDEVFVISRHPVMKYEYIRGKHYSRVKDYTEEPTSELLAIASVIVTDYSSVIFDASLLGCPSVFYCPDYDSYERDFYLQYPDELPGPVVYEASELLGVVREAIENPPKEKIEAFIEKEMSACDGNSTQRVVELIKTALKK